MGGKRWGVPVRRPALSPYGRGAAAQGRLTPMQERVLRMRATGLSAQEVAASLFVCPSTVRMHHEQAYRTLNAHNLQQALLAAGIVTITEK